VVDVLHQVFIGHYIQVRKRLTLQIKKHIYGISTNLDSQGTVAVTHIGCYTSLKRHPILHGWKIILNKQTPKQCVYGCFARRFLYAALISS